MDYDDRGLAALPRLVGGPKYSRPPVGIQRVERPPDPDDLPLVSERTPEDRELASQLGLDGMPALTATTDAGPAAAPSPSRRGFGGLFRGRHSRSDAG